MSLGLRDLLDHLDNEHTWNQGDPAFPSYGKGWFFAWHFYVHSTSEQTHEHKVLTVDSTSAKL